MSRTKRNMGTKYRAIVFFEKDTGIAPVKYEDWGVHDYSINKGHFQKFIKAKHPFADYANLYDKETKKYVKRIKF